MKGYIKVKCVNPFAKYNKKEGELFSQTEVKDIVECTKGINDVLKKCNNGLTPKDEMDVLEFFYKNNTLKEDTPNEPAFKIENHTIVIHKSNDYLITFYDDGKSMALTLLQFYDHIEPQYNQWYSLAHLKFLDMRFMNNTKFICRCKNRKTNEYIDKVIHYSEENGFEISSEYDIFAFMRYNSVLNINDKLSEKLDLIDRKVKNNL